MPPIPVAERGPTHRQRAALAVVREVIGDAREQLEVMRRISVGLPVQVHERLADGTIREHYLRPAMRDIREACMFLVERRWGRSRWAEAAAGEHDSTPALQMAEGMRLRLREVARELVLERVPDAVEKGHSPRDAEPDEMAVIEAELAPVWPAQGVGVPAPRPAGGGGGRGNRGPNGASVGPLIERRASSMPEPLRNIPENIPAGAQETPMPAPCSMCGHVHGEECEEWMPGFGRSCRCPEYVDPDVAGEEVTVVEPEAQVVADGMALAARAGREPEGRCGCGHELVEHFATPASTRCTVCGCRGYVEWRPDAENEGALMEHFAKVAKRGVVG